MAEKLPATRMEREFGAFQARRSAAFLRFTQRKDMPMTYGAGKAPVLAGKSLAGVAAERS